MIFEIGHIAAGQVYFFSLNPKNRRASPKILFSKITGTLKINTCFGKLPETFLIHDIIQCIKEQSHKF